MTTEAHSLEVVPLRHPWRWIGAGLVVAASAWIVYKFAVSPNIGWHIVGDYLFAAPILRGLEITLLLTVLTMIASVMLGVVVALMHLSENPVLSSIARIYVWIGRAMPSLVVILLWFNLALVFPRLGVGGFSADTNSVLTPFVTALIALTLTEAPYLGEIIRGGLLSVDQGQREAAQALGMRRAPILRKIVLPQAMRGILPPLGNEVITVLKATSLVSVVAAQELLTSAQNIYSVTFEVMELLIVVTIWYLVLTSLAMLGQSQLERRFSRGMTR